MEPLSEAQRNVILEIRDDFYRYADNNLYIKDKDSNIVKFVPNVAQKELIDRVLWLLKNGKPVRIIILKARQMGLSTAVEALIFWWTTTHKNITSVIISFLDESSANLYNMFKRYYANANPIFKPTRKYDNKSDLKFSKEDREGNETGLGSIIKTATARNISTGRSDTVQIIHGSEVASWPDGESLVASLLQTVPTRPNTMIFLESTAEGRGNFFYKYWTKSVKGETNFETFFFPWWIQEEYEMDGDPGEYTEEENDIAQLMTDGMTIGNNHYTVPEEQIKRKIMFRRYKEREFSADPKRLYQEYPSTAHEAFIASGRPVFDIKSLSHMEKQCKEDHEDKRYELEEDNERNIKAVETDRNARLKIFKMPERGVDYVIGADPAEGIKDGDFSVADVIDTRTMETVARYRGRPDPDQFGYILDRLGRFYNFALMGVEINNHGLAVVQRLRDLFYTNLYRRERGIDERFEESTTKLGWKTTVQTKPLAIDYLVEAIREGLVKDPDIVFVEEAFSYVRDDRGRTNAEEGSHDDTVMAKAIALQMYDWSMNNKADLKVHIPNKYKSRKNKHKMLR